MGPVPKTPNVGLTLFIFDVANDVSVIEKLLRAPDEDSV
jgi:hypothetical protein